MSYVSVHAHELVKVMETGEGRRVVRDESGKVLYALGYSEGYMGVLNEYAQEMGLYNHYDQAVVVDMHVLVMALCSLHDDHAVVGYDHELGMEPCSQSDEERSVVSDENGKNLHSH